MAAKTQSHEHDQSQRHAGATNSFGALYLIFIQVASRALTFIGNQFLLRYISPEHLGLAVQLELVSISILYFSRESLRVALQRQPSEQPLRASGNESAAAPKAQIGLQTQRIVNVSYLVMVIGALSSVVFGYGYLKNSSTEATESTDFWNAFFMYAFATVIELVTEPAFVVIQRYGLYKARAQAETSAAIARCLASGLTAVLLRHREQPPSVLPFAVGQLLYSVVLFVAYLASLVSVMDDDNFSLSLEKLPTADGSDENYLDYFSKPLVALASTLYAQSIFKLFLTQGDGLILSFFADLKTQGAFALASNYGGLLSRLLFQPVEESSRNIFGALLVAQDDETADRSQKRRAALDHLATILHAYFILSSIMIPLLPQLLPVLVHNLVGSRWAGPGTSPLLSAYAYYIPFLAFNGILDAFVTSVATPSQLRTQSLVMAGITATYALVAWYFITQTADMGPSGLVWANVVNMLLRIVYSWSFIRQWIERNMSESGQRSYVKKAIRTAVPLESLITALVVAATLHYYLHDNSITSAIAAHTLMEKRFLGIVGLDAKDCSAIASAGAVLAGSILIFERHFLLSMASSILPRRFGGGESQNDVTSSSSSLAATEGKIQKKFEK